MKKRLITIPLLITLAGVGLYQGMRPSAAKAVAKDALRIDVKRKDLLIEVIDTGKVEPKEKIEIKSRVGGQALAVLVTEGAHVKKGDLLLQLDPVDYQREVARAEADVAQAKNALDYAKLKLARKTKATKGVARLELELAENEVKAKSISLRRTKIARATARDRLRYTKIISPIDGTVLEVGIKQGEVVTPGMQQTFEGRPLMLVGDLSSLVVKSELNQIDIAKIALGQEVQLSFDALPGRNFVAQVFKIAPSAVLLKSRNVEVFIVESLLKTDDNIKPGMTADVRFQIDRKPKVIAVPIEAVIRKSEKAFVTKLVSKEGKERTERAEVKLGARNDRSFEITEGLEVGDKLLIDPESAKENEVQL